MDVIPQARRPSCTHRSTAPGGGTPVSNAAAIALQRRPDALRHHPVEDLSGIEGKLQLQQFLPHFLLRPTQNHDIGCEHAVHGNDRAAK